MPTRTYAGVDVMVDDEGFFVDPDQWREQMAAPIEDLRDLAGKEVAAQELNPFGKVKEIFTMADGGHPSWVAIEASFGMGDKRILVVPLARMKEEEGELCVPYSKKRLRDSPSIDEGDRISPECERGLRGYYGISTGVVAQNSND